MLDAEMESRIQFTRYSLLGMVFFTNIESFSQINGWQFGLLAAAVGLGLWVKRNKYSRNRIALDHGWEDRDQKCFL